MDIRFFSENCAEAKAWDAYVAAQPAATSDHLWGWRRVLSEAFGYRPYYLGAVDDGRIVGILPLFRIPRGWGAQALSSIPFGNYGGVCADSPEIGRALLESAKDLAQDTRAQHVALHHRRALPMDSLQPQTLYHRFTMPLTGSSENHLRRMPRRVRYDINRALRLGLEVIASRDVTQLYPIHVRTFRRLGTPCFPQRYFELILQEFSPNATIHFVAFQGRMIAYDVFLAFKDQLLCLFNGWLMPFRTYRPNTLLAWSAIESGCARQMTLLDFGRNRADSGAAEFKRSLGFTEEPLGYQYYLPTKAPVPQRNPSNPKYQLLIRLWSRLPLVLTQAMGPALVRYFA